ncbi:MAG: acyl carrier protein [Alphaproteobacteria bacterium]|nr:acyl carrier protein [Alphaproteobacteria bacterium]
MTEARSMLAAVADIIAAEFGCAADDITRETTAMDVDGWDSASHVILVLEIEQQLGLTFPDDRVGDLRDVGDMVDILDDLTNRAAGA